MTIATFFSAWALVMPPAGRAQTLPFRKYTHADGLLSDEVTALCQDSRGYLWIGTPEGISVFDGAVFSSLTVREGLGAGQVNMITESEYHPGTMYLALGGGGVGTYRDGTLSTIALGGSFASNYVDHIAEDSADALWCTSAGGLYRVWKGSVSLMMPKGKAGYFEAADSIVWNATRHHIALRHPVADDSLWDLSHFDGMPKRGMTCSLLDREGVLWIGTAWEGLWKLTNNNIVSFPLSRCQPGYYDCSPAAVDRRNHFWAVSGDGLWEFWNEGRYRWHKYLHPNTSRGEHGWLIGVAVDPSDYLWLVFTGGWLTKFETLYDRAPHARLQSVAEFTPLLRSETYPKTDPVAFAFDSAGHLYYGTHRGSILEYDVSEAPRFVRELRKRESPDPGAPFAIALDRNGTIWDGSFEHGILAIMNDGRQRQFTRRDGLPDLSIRALLQDRAGRIWAGTRRGGLAVLQEGRFMPITVTDGLISNTVWSLCEDDSGRIWAATSIGLQAIDGRTLRPLTPKGHLTGYWSGKCGVSPHGQIWWHEEGVAFTIFDYLDETKNTVPPSIFITHVSANGETQSVSRPAAAAYDRNNWTIQYVGISMKDPDGVRYRYKVSGFGTGWSALTRERSITFAALPPGSYTFAVDAVNADGVSSGQPAEIAFSILPPFWKTYWFMGMSGMAACALLYFVYRYRLNKLLEVERLRTAIATDLHDDIGTGLTRIALFADASLRELSSNAGTDSGGGSIRGWLGEIGTTSRSLVDGLNDIVWAVDPKHDSFEHVLMRMKTLASRMLEARGIDYDISISPDLSDLRLSLPVRRQFFLVFKETMSNVIKHAHATRVELLVRRSDGRLVMTVRDNGVGFAVASAHRGNGLNNMRSRAVSLGGTFDVSSEPGKGTRIRFDIPLP